LARIVISSIILENTPVDVLNDIPHDPLINEKLASVYPVLVHVTVSEAVPLHLLCDSGEQVPPFPSVVMVYLGK
jgi:hypothetical protein